MLKASRLEAGRSYVLAQIRRQAEVYVEGREAGRILSYYYE